MTRRSPIRFGPGLHDTVWWRVALGGAAGAGVRWAAVAAADSSAAFPWPTLLVNVAGCLAVGALASSSPERRATWGLGFAGGLTTFSTLAVELATLLRTDDAAVASAYLAMSLVLGVAAVVLGRRFALERASPRQPAGA